MPDTQLPARSVVVGAADYTTSERKGCPLAGAAHPAPLAGCESSGVNGLHFLELKSHLVGVSIKAIGVLLVSAFVVIPACAARLLSRTFTNYVVLSTGLGALSAVVGMVVSAAFNLPSGPSIVATQLAIFLTAMGLPRLLQNWSTLPVNR